jgi:hypothetical protein
VSISWFNDPTFSALRLQREILSRPLDRRVSGDRSGEWVSAFECRVSDELQVA